MARNIEALAERELATTLRAAAAIGPAPAAPRFTQIGDLLANVRPVSWLIKGYLEQGTTACLFGDPESGKSLMALDWGLHIAAGKEWNGHRVTAGAVFLLCGEGASGLRRRARAWSIRHSMDFAKLPLFAHTIATDLSDPTAAFAIGAAIQATAEASGHHPALVIVDTLSRHLAGDENSTADMARFVAHLDAHVREPTGACVLLVHHSGHGDKSRARGSTVLRGAVDTEYRMARDAETRCVMLECSKAKDWEHPARTFYSIRVVELDVCDDDGEQVTSAILDQIDAAPAPIPTTGNQGKALAALQRLTVEQSERLRADGRDPDTARVTLADWRTESNLDRKRWPEVFDALTRTGRVIYEAPFVSLG